MSYISLIIKYRHIVGYGLAVIALICLVWYIHEGGYKACEKDQQIKSIEVAEKRNEIANNRPSDDAVFFNGLLDKSIEW